jgi:hypothetical protein
VLSRTAGFAGGVVDELGQRGLALAERGRRSSCRSGVPAVATSVLQVARSLRAPHSNNWQSTPIAR